MQIRNYLSSNIIICFFDLTHFRELTQNYSNILFRFWVQIKTLKFASEINWPLKIKEILESFLFCMYLGSFTLPS